MTGVARSASDQIGAGRLGVFDGLVRAGYDRDDAAE